MDRNRVVISGLGAVSAAGADVPSTLASMRCGKRNIATTLPFESSLRCPTFQVQADLPSGGRKMIRTVHLALAAVREAMADAMISEFGADARVGVCLGTTVACQLNNLPFYQEYRRTGDPPLEPVHEYLRSNLAQAVASEVGARGPRLTIVNACSSGTDAVGVAATWIRAGLCDVAIAGGADELSRVAVAGFWSLGVASAEPCRPFDRDRAGLNLGEGAGVVVLESAEHAQRRGFRPAFEVAGVGSACDAHHLTAPHPEGRGLEIAIDQALRQAKVEARQVAFINAHGTATLENDRVEARVLSRIFGSDAKVLSTKGYTGHTLGAAGGLEGVFTVLGLREHWIPRSAGFENAPEEMELRPLREVTKISGEYAISTSLAFGGNNAALLVRRLP